MEFSKELLDYGLLGGFVLMLIYVVSWMATKMDERITEDRRVFESINENLSMQNELYKLLIAEHKSTKIFLENVVEHEREVSKLCFDTFNELQRTKKEQLSRIEEKLINIYAKVEDINHELK